MRPAVLRQGSRNDQEESVAGEPSLRARSRPQDAGMPAGTPATHTDAAAEPAVDRTRKQVEELAERVRAFHEQLESVTAAQAMQAPAFPEPADPGGPQPRGSLGAAASGRVAAVLAAAEASAARIREGARTEAASLRELAVAEARASAERIRAEAEEHAAIVRATAAEELERARDEFISAVEAAVAAASARLSQIRTGPAIGPAAEPAEAAVRTQAPAFEPPGRPAGRRWPDAANGSEWRDETGAAEPGGEPEDLVAATGNHRFGQAPELEDRLATLADMTGTIADSIQNLIVALGPAGAERERTEA
jgi:cell division septum initiation protein DivIVA